MSIIRPMFTGQGQNLNQHDNVISLSAHRALNCDLGPHKTTSGSEQSSVLDLAARFPFHASVEINDLHWIRAQFSSRARGQVVMTVRKILLQEFGRKRVLRHGFQFEIQHRNAASLMDALVRVQFYTNQIVLPEYNLLGERIEQNGISLTWGVGRSRSGASQDRLKKRNQMLYRR